jgi:hypothetical protein
MQEIQEDFKITFLDTLLTLVGTPLSGSALDNTCIQTCASKYLWYIKSPLGILKPTIDQPIDHLNYIVPLITTLEKILSST